ncbi:MAG: hypothetical protein LBR84_11530 [Tannerella sp.]|jgi:hypothetical protein|nr:hypothetical protein [Tannerella sp.]
MKKIFQKTVLLFVLALASINVFSQIMPPLPAGLTNNGSSVDYLIDPACIAKDDAYYTLMNMPITGHVTENDIVSSSAPCGGLSGATVTIITPPTHGTATLSGQEITYTPNTDWAGKDSLKYRLSCGTLDSTAWMRIIVDSLPDNISELQCLIPVDSTAWSIQLQYLQESVESESTPAVGDLDGDGKPEIIAYKALVPIRNCYIDSIVIFWGDDRVNHVTMFRIAQNDTLAEMTTDRANPMPTVAKINMGNGTMQPLIFVPLNNGYIRAFDTTGYVVWTSDTPIDVIQPALITDNRRPSYPPNITDFDGDGLQEIYIGNQVWAAETGRLLAVGPAGGNAGRSMASDGANEYRSINSIAADLDGDGIADLAAGTHVYSVTVKDRSGLSSSNRITYKDTIPTTLCGTDLVPVRDGRTIVADVNRDGMLDVIVNVSTDTIGSASGATARAGNMGILVWTPKTRQVVATASIPRGTDPGGLFLPSPFLIGNIDSDPNIELVCVLHNQLGGWKYDGTTMLQRVWTRNLSESSGCTGVTLFDFNSDGAAEIVYRDENTLRVMHPYGSTFTDLMSWSSVVSATYVEFPVVADIDGTGTSAVLVTGSYAASGIPNQSGSNRGTLCILRSAGEPWAKARKVWNQYSYNNVNINEDLTVPRFYLNPATYFPGANGILGDADDVQPFNNYLQQQSTLDFKGIRVWPAPDVHITSIVSKQYYPDGDSLALGIRVTNTGNSLLGSPIAIAAYKGATYSAADHILTDTVLYAGIAVGDTVTLRFTIPNLSTLVGVSQLTFRVNDDGTPHIIHRECDTTNNVVQMNLETVPVATQTVQEYQSVEINILSLHLPAAFYATTFNLADSLTQQPVSGSVAMVDTGSIARLIYTNEGAAALTNHIDSFIMRITTGGTAYEIKIYVYVLAANIPLSVCDGQNWDVGLYTIPTGTTFTWYLTKSTPVMLQDSASRIIRFASGTTPADSVYWIKPTVPGASEPYNVAGGFPRGKFTVWKVNSSQPYREMHWTGIVDNNWHNPHNWTGVDTVTKEAYPVPYEPSTCINVVIPGDAPNYPEITSPPRPMCYNITVRDRGMLKNPHPLWYNHAVVELKPQPSERDRFVMWSAPTISVYSGDYHYGSTANPDWGDVYMNFFQRANPNGGVAAANTFTATFGEANAPLELGTAFNVKVVSTTRSKEQQFTFPQTVTSYVDKTGVTRNTPRAGNPYRFIVSPTTIHSSDTTFNLPVGNDVAGSDLMQVVNPYLAYLDMAQFVAKNFENSGPVAGGYIIWDGNINHSLDVGLISPVSGNGNRFVFTAPSSLWTTTPNLIPPLQSFFVQKAFPVNQVDSVKMSPNWTTTKSGRPGQYILRAAPAEWGILRIRATQGEKQSYAVLNYDENATSAYNGSEDVNTLFYDDVPLTVYTLTSMRKALSINSNSDFENEEIFIGLRLRDIGEVTLDFSGLETFGHNVWLIDKTRNQTIDLQETPQYALTIARTGDLIDRLALRFEFTGKGLVASELVAPDLIVTSGAGTIEVRSASFIENLQIYNIVGSLVYSNNYVTNFFCVPVSGQQVYVVRATIDGIVKVRKVYVK